VLLWFVSSNTLCIFSSVSGIYVWKSGFASWSRQCTQQCKLSVTICLSDWSWPNGKFHLNVLKSPKTCHLKRKKKLPKFVKKFSKKLPLAIFFFKWQFLAFKKNRSSCQFFDIQMSIFRRVWTGVFFTVVFIVFFLWNLFGLNAFEFK